MADTIVTHYVELSTGRRRVDQRVSDGYIDATAMCKAASKPWNNYYRLKSTKDYIEALAGETGIPETQLVEVKKGKTGKYEQGTWVHPDVGVHLSRWLSPEFAAEVSKWNRQPALEPGSDDSEITNDQGLRDLDDTLVFGQPQFRCFALLYQDLCTAVRLGSAKKLEEFTAEEMLPEFSDIQVIHDLAWTAYLIKKEKAHKCVSQREMAAAIGITERALRNYSSRIGGWDNFDALICAAQSLDDLDESNNDALSAISKPYWSFFAGIAFISGGDDMSLEGFWLINWMKTLDSEVWLSKTSLDHVGDEVIEKAWEMMGVCYGDGVESCDFRADDREEGIDDYW